MHHCHPAYDTANSGCPVGRVLDLRDDRLTEAFNPHTAGIDDASPLEIVRLMNREDRKIAQAVASQEKAIAAVIDEVATGLARGGRLFYVGAGTSGRLGVLDASECPPTFGADPETVQGIIAGGPEALVRSLEGAEDDAGAGREAIGIAGIGERDFVLGIASSGTTPFVHAALEAALEAGAATGLLACTAPPQDITSRVGHLITPLTGPEAIAGSTRLKAGTATKMVLNMISTGAMIRLGKVYGNLMVDLRAVSRKLVDRGLRIITALTGLDDGDARRLLCRMRRRESDRRRRIGVEAETDELTHGITSSPRGSARSVADRGSSGNPARPAPRRRGRRRGCDRGRRSGPDADSRPRRR